MSVYIVARLGDGQTVQAAQAAISAALKNWSQDGNLNGRALSLREDIMGPATPPVWLLVVTAVALFGVAAGSAVSRSMSEAVARQHETAIRVALGATPSTLWTQTLVESLLQLVIAGPAGVLLAFLVLRGIAVSAPEEVVSAFNLSTPLVRTGFVGAVAMALAVALVPIVALAHKSHRHRPTYRTGYHAESGRALENIAIAQVALAMVLVGVANLLVATFVRLTTRPIGFEATNLGVISLRVSEFPAVEQGAGAAGMFATWRHTEGLTEAVEAVPGVMTAAGVNAAPFNGSWPTTRIVSPTQPELGEFNVQIQVVTSKYFDVMRVPLIQGRRFDEWDRQRAPEQSELTAIASVELARLLGGTAVGRRVRSTASGKTYEVVGIVGNVRQRSLADHDVPTLYLLSPIYTAIHDLIYRQADGQPSLLPKVAAAIRAYDPSIVIQTTSMMADLVSQTTAPERFRAILAAGFASMTLSLAALGAYAVAARLVAVRRREIDIRLALGATTVNILLSMMPRAARVIGLSALLGLAGALASALLLRGFLFGASMEIRQSVLATVFVTAVTGAIFVGPVLCAIRRTQYNDLRE